MKVELLDYLLADPSYSLDEAINIIDFYGAKELMHLNIRQTECPIKQKE